MTKYIVGSADGERFYRDTRNESGHGEFSNWFTSSDIPASATQYNSFTDADAWRREFLGESDAYEVFEYDPDGEES